MNKVDILDEAPKRLETAAATFARVRDGLKTVIFGQDEVIEQTLVTLLAGGHGLLIGVPGLAKTKLVDSLGHRAGAGHQPHPIHARPDAHRHHRLGSDGRNRIAASAPSASSGDRSSPSLLMADEINRASPRTQSALLQAMQEKHVTVAGARYDLPRLFHVLATQNPLEQEGTYPLPEAQLDRFLLQIDVGYPDLEAERRMLLATTMGEEERASEVCGPDDLMQAQALVRRMPVGEKVMESILTLVRAARPDSDHDEATRPDRLGPRPARQPGLHAGGARPRPAGWTAGAFHRRYRGAGGTGAAPSHGAEFRGPRRRRHHRQRDRTALPRSALTRGFLDVLPLRYLRPV